MVHNEDEIDDVVQDEILPEDIQDNEAIENSEVSEESDPAIIQDEEDDEEDRIVTIGDSVTEGEAEETEDKEETPGWVKKVRKSNRRLESENKKLKRQIEANQRATEIVKPVELGEKPTLKGCKYDEEIYASELDKYSVRKRQVEEQAQRQAKTVEEQSKKWQSRQEAYTNLKKEHGFKDFEDAEELVSNTFSQTQQGIVVHGADDSALLVYALGKNPKKLEELSKITDNVEFAFAVAKLEKDLKVTNRKAPAPEKRVSARKSGGISGNSDKTLESLRTEAEKTGDYTKVTAYKRKLRNKG